MKYLRKLKYYFNRLPKSLSIKLVILEFLRKKFSLQEELGFYFSQTGEDVILGILFRDKQNGFYVEVGCNEPVKYSNTFRFYLQGWNGILIDANKELVAKNKRIRKQDLVLRAAVSDTEGQLVNFHLSSTSAVSTISDQFKNEHKETWDYIETEQLYTQTLASIFNEHLNGRHIDLLSIDIEGHDYNALISFDLNKVRPAVIIIEAHKLALDHPGDNKICAYLLAHHYKFIGYACMNAYFADRLTNT